VLKQAGDLTEGQAKDVVGFLYALTDLGRIDLRANGPTQVGGGLAVGDEFRETGNSRTRRSPAWSNASPGGRERAQSLG